MYHIIRWDGEMIASFLGREEAIRRYEEISSASGECFALYNNAGVNICPGIVRTGWGE